MAIKFVCKAFSGIISQFLGTPFSFCGCQVIDTKQGVTWRIAHSHENIQLKHTERGDITIR